MSKDNAAKWPRDVADGIGRERQNNSRHPIKGWKEEAIEDQRGKRVVDREIVPLERSPYGTCCRKPAFACPCEGVYRQMRGESITAGVCLADTAERGRFLSGFEKKRGHRPRLQGLNRASR